MAAKLKPNSLKTLALALLRVSVSGLFLAAGILKLRDADATLIAVYQYKLLSWQASGVVGTLLPFVEITMALALWIPRVRLGAAVLCVCLNLLFLTALGSALARNLDVSCGCFGTTDLYTTAARRMIEDAVLLFLSLVLLRGAVIEHSARLQSKLESGK